MPTPEPQWITNFQAIAASITALVGALGGLVLGVLQWRKKKAANSKKPLPSTSIPPTTPSSAGPVSAPTQSSYEQRLKEHDRDAQLRALMQSQADVNEAMLELRDRVLVLETLERVEHSGAHPVPR